MAVSPSSGLYSFTFDTKAEYLTAKASGGVIYAALVSGTEVSCTSVSYIKELGRTFVDAINPIVDRKYGDIGDALLYKDGTFYWNKGGAKSWNATSLGSVCAVSSRLGAYTLVGYMGARIGNTATILCSGMVSSKYKLRGTADSKDGVPLFSYISRNYASSASRLYNITYGVPSYLMGYTAYPSTNNQYAMPITKAQWDEICGYAKAGTDVATTTATYYSYSVTSGVATISITIASATVTVNPADYDYDFEKWYNSFMVIKFPCHRMASSDMDGKGNTAKLLAYNDSPLATAINTIGVSGVTGFEAGDWWIPSLGELLPVVVNFKKIKDKGLYCNGNTWMSTARGSTTGYYLNFGTATMSSASKTTSYQTFPITYFSLV